MTIHITKEVAGIVLTVLLAAAVFLYSQNRKRVMWDRHNNAPIKNGNPYDKVILIMGDSHYHASHNCPQVKSAFGKYTWSAPFEKEITDKYKPCEECCMGVGTPGTGKQSPLELAVKYVLGLAALVVVFFLLSFFA